MSDVGAHVGQAEHNEAFFEHLEAATPNYLDWQVTCLFYAALHYVDAYLATKPGGGTHPKQHETRDRLVATEASLRVIYAHYRELKDRSIDARYEVVRFSPAQLASLRTLNFGAARSRLRDLLQLRP